MTTPPPPSAPRLDDAVYSLALHLYVVDRAKQGERVTLDTARDIARIAGLRSLHPTTDVLWLGFELVGTVVQPLAPETIDAKEELVRQDPQGAQNLKWLREVISSHSVSALGALLA